MTDVIPDFSELELGGVETTKASPEELEKVMAADVEHGSARGVSLARDRAMVALLVNGLLFSFAAEPTFVVFGAWLGWLPVGGWEAGNFHRTVCEGPRVDGPQAWMNENATVLTAHKQTPRETILVEPGDHVILRGTEYEIVKSRTGHMSLVPATA